MRIEVERYKAFRDRTRFEIEPLTLLYGRNQAGKSTLIRLLALLGDSLRDEVPALDLQSQAIAGATLRELGWLGPDPSSTPILRIGGTDGATLKLQYTDDDGVVVNRLDIEDTGDPKRLSLSYVGGKVGTTRSVMASYEGIVAGQEFADKLRFTSLLPTGALPPKIEGHVTRVREALGPLTNMQWLVANRTLESRAPQRAIRLCDPRGADLASLLKSRRPIIQAASETLFRILGYSLEVRDDGLGPRFLLRRGGTEALPAHLAGEGARAIIPILTLCAWAQSDEADRPTLLAIEEPESQLHPSAQVKLFETLSMTSEAAPIVVETHSVYMLRAMQLAVAEGRLDPARVALYWCDMDHQGAARLQRITVRTDGTLANWNPEAFEEEQSLNRALAESRWRAKVGR